MNRTKNLKRGGREKNTAQNVYIKSISACIVAFGTKTKKETNTVNLSHMIYSEKS